MKDVATSIQPVDLDSAQVPSRRQLLRVAGLVAAGGLLGPAVAQTRLLDPRGNPLAPNADLTPASPGGVIADGIRAAILGALNSVPVAGGLLSYIGALLIPLRGETAEQRWQRQIGEHVTANTVALISADLAGLSNVAALYRSAVSNGNASTLLKQSIAARTVFAATLPRFRLSGQERPLLPLFVIAASMELALLRDMALKGAALGLNPAEVNAVKSDLSARIRAYQTYVDMQVAAELAEVRRNNPNRGTPATRNHPLQPMLWRKAALQVSVIDIRDTWYAFDAAVHPGSIGVQLSREIHLMAGWWNQLQPAPDSLPSYRAPTSRIATLELFFSTYRRRNYSAGTIVNYGDGTTLRTGTINGNIERIVVPATSAIDLLRIHFGSVVSQIDVRVVGRTRAYGASDTLVDRVTLSPAQHQLSSLRSTGTGRNTNNTHDSGFIAGFQLREQRAAPISLQLFDDLAPRIAPQLLEWIAN